MDIHTPSNKVCTGCFCCRWLFLVIFLMCFPFGLCLHYPRDPQYHVIWLDLGLPVLWLVVRLCVKCRHHNPLCLPQPPLCVVSSQQARSLALLTPLSLLFLSLHSSPPAQKLPCYFSPSAHVCVLFVAVLCSWKLPLCWQYFGVGRECRGCAYPLCRLHPALHPVTEDTFHAIHLPNEQIELCFSSQ